MWTAAGQPAAALLPPPDEPVDVAGVVVFAGEDSFDEDSDDDEPSEGAFSVPPERLSVR